MVKSITSAKNFVKTFVLSALLWGFAATLALSPLEAFSQQKPAVPTVHNKKLDEKCLKFCDNDEEKKEMLEFLSDIYSQQGSYLGSATIQQNLDVNMFLKFLNGDIEILKKFDKEAYNKIDRDAMKQVVEKSEPIKQWLNENYFKAYNEPFGQFDHPPDARELKASIDSYVEEDPNKLFENGQLIFKYYSMLYREKVEESSMSIPLKYSNLIAYEVNRADYILFTNLLEVSGLCKGYDKNLEILMDMIAPDVE